MPARIQPVAPVEDTEIASPPSDKIDPALLAPNQPEPQLVDPMADDNRPRDEDGNVYNHVTLSVDDCQEFRYWWLFGSRPRPAWVGRDRSPKWTGNSSRVSN